MRLLNVDGQKVRSVAVACVDLLQAIDRPPERGSREATEDEDEGLLSDEVVQIGDRTVG